MVSVLKHGLVRTGRFVAGVFQVVRFGYLPREFVVKQVLSGYSADDGHPENETSNDATGDGNGQRHEESSDLVATLERSGSVEAAFVQFDVVVDQIKLGCTFEGSAGRELAVQTDKQN